MKKLLTFFLALGVSYSIYAQVDISDSIKNNVADTIRIRKNEIGVNLLPFVTGFDINSNAPMIQYKRLFKHGAFRSSLLMVGKQDFSSEKFELANNDSLVKHLPHNIRYCGTLQLGYEWRTYLNNDWAVFLGTDLLCGIGKFNKVDEQTYYKFDTLSNSYILNSLINNKNTNSATTVSNLYRIGVSIILGVDFPISNRINLSLFFMDSFYNEFLTSPPVGEYKSKFYINDFKVFLVGSIAF